MVHGMFVVFNKPTQLTAQEHFINNAVLAAVVGLYDNNKKSVFTLVWLILK
jgi:hypothetical protein